MKPLATPSLIDAAISLPDVMKSLGNNARHAAPAIQQASSSVKRTILRKAAQTLRERADLILSENAKDLAFAQEKQLSEAVLDRILLTHDRISAMIHGLEAICEQEDPVGKILSHWERPNGLHIEKVSIPLGVIGIIYEARPNVTCDAAGLCIYSGNAAILRSGAECLFSSQAIISCFHHALEAANLPESIVQLVPTRDRDAVSLMLTMKESIDVLIPRGGKALTEKVSSESTIPTLYHLTGNCHTYIHKDADPEMAKTVLLNAKMRRTGICGATESLVMDAPIALTLLPELTHHLARAGCLLKGDLRAQSLDARIQPATIEDWSTEYLAPILSVKIVDSLEEAVAHINHFGSHHTDAIITENHAVAAYFLENIDSAIVMHNTSTQFADGGEFGFGAEIGIATGRLHARGPVGAAQLTTYKYVVKGSGQLRPK